MTVRAKFRCNTVEMSSPAPTEVKRYAGPGVPETTATTWPRTYRFSPTYDPSIPEDVRYAQASPSGELRIQVDNPAVSFTPGGFYYLDFTEVDQ